MSTHYRLYGNGGLGWSVPVDPSVPIASTTDGATTADVALDDGEWLLVVRAYDSVSGLEDGNLDAIPLRLVDGEDATGLPPAPRDLSVADLGGGEVLLMWTDPPSIYGGRSTGYLVWATEGDAIDLEDAPVATTPRTAGPLQSARLTLSAGDEWTLAVRSTNGLGASGPSESLTLTPGGSTPEPVEGLSAGTTG